MTVYVFRVWLCPNPPLGFEPDTDVWRDIELDGSHTLEDFHEAIFEAFNRRDTHGYEFIAHDEDGTAIRTYVDPHLYDGESSRQLVDTTELEHLVEQVAPDDGAEAAKRQLCELRMNQPTEADAGETTIDELEPECLQSLSYEFDFGDGWEHHIELHDVRVESLDGRPSIIDEQGDAPPQYPDFDE